MKTENREFQRKIGKLQAKNVTLENRIDLLEKETPQKSKFYELDFLTLLEKASNVLKRHGKLSEKPEK